MSITLALLAALSAVDVEILKPVDGGVYTGDWLTLRVLVENDGVLPDSVTFSLNGEAFQPVPRLYTDWYTYKGDDLHTGFSESPAPIDPSILWIAPVCGTTHEFPNPVIVEGIVYYPSNYGTDSLYALDAATGEVIWKYLVGSTDDAVTVKEGLLFTNSGDSLYCFDALDGDRLWASGASNASGNTPVVFDDRVYGGNCISPQLGDIICFDASSGEVEWTERLSGYSGSCMAIWEGILFVPTSSSYGADPSPLYALDASTGGVIWSTTVDGGFWDSSPVIVDGTIFIGTFGGSLIALDCLTGQIMWDTPLEDPITATPACHDGSLFVGTDQSGTDGVFVRVDASTGQIQWSRAFSIHGSPSVAGGLVFFGETNFGMEARLIALDCATGETVWTYAVEAEWFAGTPAVSDGIVYMPAHDGNLYAFGSGLKWTYRDDLFAEVGDSQLLVVNSWSGGAVAAGDTIQFSVTQTGIEPGPGVDPSLAAAPNPFSVASDISFEMLSSGYANLKVFDLGGRLVVTLESGFLPAGTHTVSWDGLDGSGGRVFPGCYLVRFESGQGASALKLLLLLP